MDTSTIITLIGVAGTLCAIVSACIGYKKGVQKDGSAEGSLRSDVGYIKAGVDDLKSEQKSLNKMHYELSDRVARVEESAKSAHHRLDGMEKRLNGTEETK